MLFLGFLFDGLNLFWKSFAGFIKTLFFFFSWYEQIFVPQSGTAKKHFEAFKDWFCGMVLEQAL